MMKSDSRSMTPGLRRRWTRAPGSAEKTRPDSPQPLSTQLACSLGHTPASHWLSPEPHENRAFPAKDPLTSAQLAHSASCVHQGGVATAAERSRLYAAGSQRIPCYLSNCTHGCRQGCRAALLGRGRGRAAVRPGERRIQLRGSTVRPGKRFPQGHLLNLTRWFRLLRHLCTVSNPGR